MQNKKRGQLKPKKTLGDFEKVANQAVSEIKLRLKVDEIAAQSGKTKTYKKN